MMVTIVVAALHDYANKVVRLPSLSSRHLSMNCIHCATCAMRVVHAHAAVLFV